MSLTLNCVYCFTGFIGIIGGLIFHVRQLVRKQYTCKLRDIIIHMTS